MARLCSLCCVTLQEMADVQESFAMVGATHALNELEMDQWCATVFGSLSDAEYNDQMEQLYEASSFWLHIACHASYRFVVSIAIAAAAHVSCLISMIHFACNDLSCSTMSLSRGGAGG